MIDDGRGFIRGARTVLIVYLVVGIIMQFWGMY